LGVPDLPGTPFVVSEPGLGGRRPGFDKLNHPFAEEKEHPMAVPTFVDRVVLHVAAAAAW
jgi:hypothetical protein